MNLVEALNKFGTNLTGATVAGKNEQEALNAIATSLKGSTVAATNWVEAIDEIADAVYGKSVVTLEDKNITAEGTFTPSSGKAWKKVVVDIADSSAT